MKEKDPVFPQCRTGCSSVSNNPFDTEEKRLFQVITNFINNALKFTIEGHILLDYKLKENTNEVEFSVTDTGIGIAPDIPVSGSLTLVGLNKLAATKCNFH